MLFALTVLSSAVLASCSKENGSTVSEYLEIVLDKTVIEANGIDAVNFSVVYDGIDVSDKAVVYNADGTVADIPDMKFITETEGSYSFYAEYNSERSPEVTVTAIGSSLPEIPQDPQPESTDFARKALVTLFTSIDCSYCPYSVLALDELSKSQVWNQYVLVECHSKIKQDPAWYGGPLVSVCGSMMTPYLSVDLDRGISYEGANPVTPALVASYRGLILNAVNSRPAKAAIAASSTLSAGNVIVSMSVKAAETGEYRVGAWLLEDGIYGKQLNGGASGLDFDTHNNCLRYAQYTGEGSSADYTGVSLGTVNAGEEAAYTFSIPVESGWNAGNCHLVLFVTAGDGSAFYVNNAASLEIGGTVAYEYN